jgi:hypothetical protein
VAVDSNDTDQAVQKFLTDSKYSFKAVLGGRGPEYTIGKAYGVSGYPTNFLVGPDGKVLWVGVGYSPKLFEELQAAVKKAVE